MVKNTNWFNVWLAVAFYCHEMLMISNYTYLQMESIFMMVPSTTVPDDDVCQYI